MDFYEKTLNEQGIEGLLAKAIRDEKVLSSEKIALTPSIIQDPQNYIILPAGTYGKHDYPDLLIGMRRLSYNSDVEAVNQRNGWQIKNTAKVVDVNHSYDYIGNINHEQAIQLNQELGNATPSLVLGREFLRLLDSGINSKKKVYDGAGKTLDGVILRRVFDDITKVQDPRRAEWFDTGFSGTKKDMKITYPVYTENHWEYTTEDLEDCLMKNRILGIVLDDWLTNSTSQGLPLKDSKKGELSYRYPKNKRVARFGAYSIWFGLDCGWYPSYAYASLGVRCMRAKI